MPTKTKENTAVADKYAIISSDCHAGANMSTYREYLDPAFIQEFDDWRGEYKNPFRDLQGEDRDRNWDSERRNRELDEDGIIGEIIFPNTVPPFFPTGALIAPQPKPKDFERRLAGIRAHNRWLAEWCSEFPERRAGIAQIFLNDVDEAIKDVQFAKENNLRGGVLLPGVAPDAVHLAPLYSNEYERLWDACEDLDVTLNHHSGGGSPNYGKHPTSGVMFLIETPYFSHRALWHMLMSGIFERHPKLRLVLTEQGLSWVPPLLRQLDGYHAQMKGGRVGELGFPAEIVTPQKPSDYFAQNCYIGASFPPPSEASATAEVGWDKVMWGSDYPHNEGCYPYSTKALQRSFSGATPEQLKMILSENQAKVYGFDLEALQAQAQLHGPSIEELSTPLDKIPDSPSPAFTRT